MPDPRLPDQLPLPQEVLEIATRLETAGYETWCVGGALRDAALNQVHDDVDLATAATPDIVRSLFPHTVAVGLKFGTVGVLDRTRRLHEVTTFRRDVTTDGRHAVVEYGASLLDDLARRDFTINAMAYHPLRREWRDPFGGAEDLERGVIRAVGNPAERFREDYLRILRGIRFAARLGFEIHPPTWEAAVAAVAEGGLRRLSAERVREEWFKGLATALSLRRLVDLWRAVGAAAVWLPELLPGYPFAGEDPRPRDQVVLTAGLCRDPEVALERLRASGAEIARAGRIAAGPAAPPAADALTVRRWLARVGDAADDLLLLAGWHEGREPAWAEAVRGIRARGEALARADLAVTGDDLRALGVPPGPRLGEILSVLLELVLERPELNRREVLLERAKALA